MSDLNKEGIGALLRKLREIKGFSLREVERRSGVSNAYLSQIEGGKVKNPSPHHLFKLAKVYEIEYSELMKAAGYAVSLDSPKATKRSLRNAALASIDDLSDVEMRELEDFVKFLRSRRKRS